MRLSLHYLSLSYGLIISTGLVFALLCVLLIFLKLAVKALVVPLIFIVTVVYMSLQKIRRSIHPTHKKEDVAIA